MQRIGFSFEIDFYKYIRRSWSSLVSIFLSKMLKNLTKGRTLKKQVRKELLRNKIVPNRMILQN